MFQALILAKYTVSYVWGPITFYFRPDSVLAKQLEGHPNVLQNCLSSLFLSFFATCDIKNIQIAGSWFPVALTSWSDVTDVAFISWS